jgi:hypothetical protein
MSVFMALRVKADPQRIKEALLEADWQGINARAKQAGCLHHRFMTSGDEVLVADEWETREGFEQFFGASEDIRELMGRAGITSEPEIRFWEPVDTPDQF